MGKVVKIPLVMKNGEKATDMKTLIDNFDVESVVGYFLDGKLEKWLNARYYEEEAEAIAQIDREDPALAKLLCEVFGIEYEEDEELNPEAIAQRKKRIARLKQLTDDENVWNHVDFVAFNQEELAELYDNGVQRIYLCEGFFHIPKSKQDLEYMLIGNPQVTGLRIEKPSNCDEDYDVYKEPFVSAYFEEQSISVEVADLIQKNSFVELKDYVVVTSPFNKLTSINKETGEVRQICNDKATGRTALDGNIVWYTLHKNGTQRNVIHNLDTDEIKQLEISLSFSTRFSKCDSKILFNMENNILQLFYIQTHETTSLFIDGNITEPIKSEHFILTDTKIFYISKATRGELSMLDSIWRNMSNEGDMHALYCYDLETQKCEELCNLLDYRTYIHNFIYQNETFYLVATNSAIRCDNQDLMVIEYSALNGCRTVFSDRMKSGIACYSHPYVVYVPEISSFPIYYYNVEKNVSMQIARGCGKSYSGSHYVNRFSIVEQWLYYSKGEDEEIYRIDLENPVMENKVN